VHKRESPDAELSMAVDREGAQETRLRLIAALAGLIDERGYGAITVVDIVREARASKRTYYQQFANKQECYLALQAYAVDDLIERVRAAVDPDAHWHDQVRQMVAAYADASRVRIGVAVSFVRDLPAMGSPGRAVQRRNYAAMIELIVGLAANPGFQRNHVEPLTPQAATILIAGIRELAAQAVEDGTEISTIIGPATASAIALMSATASRT
jgi:AcrR family transcriptional regulator